MKISKFNCSKGLKRGDGAGSKPAPSIQHDLAKKNLFIVLNKLQQQLLFTKKCSKTCFLGKIMV